MHTPPIVSPPEWEAAREQLLVKEKALTRARDALAAERRRMPWLAVQKAYEFDGPAGKASLLDLFDGRRQLVVYRAFFEPGVFGWPEHACRGCSLVADQVAHVAHLNARDTTLAFVSRAPQTDIARVKARMGWEMPWYTITDGFDTDFGVGEWHGTNVFFRDGDSVLRTYFINNRGDEAMGRTWSYLDMTPLGRQEEWEDSPEGCDENANAAALGAADWLSLAAAPTFAIMALLTGALDGGPADMLCSAARASPLSGMVPDVLADERLPFGGMAEADLQPTKRCPPVLIRRSPDRAARQIGWRYGIRQPGGI